MKKRTPSSGQEYATPAAGRREDDSSLAIRAAWLHYAAGMTQSEVAARLGVSKIKAHRLVAQANQSGAVKISIDGDVAACAALEARLADRFALGYCEVVPDLHDGGLPLRALGIAGARFLQRQIEALEHGVIGVGHGRTLAAAVAALPRMKAATVRFVSLLGGVTRNYAANPHDVIHRLAEKTGAAAYVMPVPFFANSAQDREVLLSQGGVRDVFDLAARADLMVVGIGTAQADAQLVASHMISAEELSRVRAEGGAGEMLGHFFDRAGRPVKTALSERTVSPDLEGLRQHRIVAIAGGREKVVGIASVLRSGLLHGLITDELTALALTSDELF